MPVTKAQIQIENIVATTDLKQQLDLNLIKKTLRGSEYDSKRFPGLIYRLRKPEAATLIFSTGKMVCTGANSEARAKRAIRKVVEKLREEGMTSCKNPIIGIKNIVASVNLSGWIDLERAAFALGRVMYEPEQFPALIYRMEDPRVVLLIFSSGKLVCSGATSEEEIYVSVTRLHNKLEEEQLILYRGPTPNQ